jgi:hypothetical protein
MIVDDLDIGRPSRAAPPLEADAPLHVDTDAVLASTIRIEKIDHFGFVLPKRPLEHFLIVYSFFAIIAGCPLDAPRRGLEWQIFAATTLAVHTGPGPITV